MNPQEMQTLETFLSQLTQARAGAKDPQAEALIADALVRQPDAAYLLVQRALLLEHALASAKAQIATLQNQLQAAQTAGSASFLDPANAWGNSAASRPVMPPAAATTAPVAPVAQQAPSAATPTARPGFLSSGLGSTLGSIATTAAGVAGGAFLFQGIENLLHHNSASGFLAPAAMGAMPSETSIVNNYYESGQAPSRFANDAVSDSNFLDDGLSGDSFMDDDPSII